MRGMYVGFGLLAAALSLFEGTDPIVAPAAAQQTPVQFVSERAQPLLAAAERKPVQAAPTVHASTPTPPAQPTAPQAADRPAPSGSWPKTLPEAKAEALAKIAPGKAANVWTPADIALGKARCAHILAKLEMITVPEAPIREGECGAPAPVRVISIGKKPEVALSPPPVVTCDMAAAMHDWVKSSVQPLARKHLGGEVIKIETMSDYSCRNAYGRAKTRLSEHGKANALDIRGFTTTKGDTAILLDDWGLTRRDVAAQAAAAKAAAEKLAAEKAAAAAAAATQARAPAPKVGPFAGEAARSTIIEGVPRVTITLPGSGGGAADAAATFGVAPDRLGGPRPPPPDPLHTKTVAPAAPSKRDMTSGKMQFLREAHTEACKIFGTVLGPESNNAHRNHFHVDMAERKSGNFCE